MNVVNRKDLRFLFKKRRFPFQKNVFFSNFCEFIWKTLFYISMLNTIYINFEHANTLISKIAPSLVEWIWSFMFQESIFFFQKKLFFLFFYKYIHVIVPMLRPNSYSPEHANTILSIIWLSLIEGDLIFLCKVSIFFYQKKVPFLIYLRIYSQ